MKYVIKLEKLEGIAVVQSADVGTWLKSYDPEAYDGRGDVQATTNRDEAMRFDSLQEAHELWKRQPKARPLRDDGKPNRPLSAFTIRVEPA